MLEAWNPRFLWSVAVGPARARPASEGPVALWTSVPRAAALRRGLTGPRSGKLGRRVDAPRLPLCLSVCRSVFVVSRNVEWRAPFCGKRDPRTCASDPHRVTMGTDRGTGDGFGIFCLESEIIFG